MKIKRILFDLALALGFAAFFGTLSLAQSPNGEFLACEKHTQIVRSCVCSAAKGPVTAAREARKLPKLEWPPTGYAWVVLGGYTPCNPGRVITQPAAPPAAQPTRAPTRSATTAPSRFVTATPIDGDVLVTAAKPTPAPDEPANIGGFQLPEGGPSDRLIGFLGGGGWLCFLAIALIGVLFFVRHKLGIKWPFK